MTKRIRVAISPYMANLVNGVAKLMGRTEPDALEQLLFRIETAARHGKLADAGLGLEWVEVADVLNSNGQGAINKDPVLVSGGVKIDFDVRLLEPGKRGKSGYAGVYATGSSFRAMVPDPEGNGGSRYLQSRPTAVLAAIDRYEWYQRWALPYGELGDFVEEVMTQERARGTTMLQALEYALTMVGSNIKQKFTEAQVRATIARYKELHPEETKVSPKLPKVSPQLSAPAETKEPVETAAADDDEPAYVEPAADELCAVCKKVIAADDRFTFFGRGDGMAHVGCVDLDGKPLKKQTATP